MNNIFRRVLIRLYRTNTRTRISFWRSAIMNFAYLPFRQAIKFPILIWGRMKMPLGNGAIRIDYPQDKIYKGMIKFNRRDGAPGFQGQETEILLDGGEITFRGPATIGRGVRLQLIMGGKLNLGYKSHIGHGANIVSFNKISIDDDSRLGFMVQIHDSDFHFSFDQSYKVKRNTAEVYIGKYCWIATRAMIMKGVRLPDYTTVSSNSLVNRNLTNKPFCLLGGTPAKLLKEDFCRVWNQDIEKELKTFFTNNPSENEKIICPNYRDQLYKM